MLSGMHPCHAQHIGIENFERNVQPFRVFLEVLAALRRITRVHCKEHEVKIHRVLQILQQQCQQHGILAARDAHRNLIARFYQSICFYRVHERLAQCTHKFALQRSFYLFRSHFAPFLC